MDDSQTTRLELLEARVRQLEHERELRELLARYSFTADLGRTREYADLYTEDGAIDLRGQNMPRFEGRESIYADFINGPKASSRAGKAFHHAAPTVFFIDGDEAEAEGYSLMWVLEDDGSVEVRNANYSHWRFRRVDGRWYIVERVVRLLGAADAEKMFTRTIQQRPD